MTTLWQVLALSLAVSAISTTISISSLFGPIRHRVGRRSLWLGKLINCAYCSSHWIAFFAVAWYQPRIFPGWWFANYMVAVFCVIAVANVVTGVVRSLNYFAADSVQARQDVHANATLHQRADSGTGPSKAPSASLGEEV